MRILVRLEAIADYAYDLKYNHKLQGFIYGLLKDTSYRSLHDRRGYKFFCFSNIFPPKDFRRGEIRHLLVSSPDGELVEFLEEKIRLSEKINIGDMSFMVKDLFILSLKVGENCVLESGTPIIIRIPKENYEKYGIEPPKDYNYIYWRKQYPFSAFIKQLEDNLTKKYNTYYGVEVEVDHLFDQFQFKKQVCNHIIVKGREVKVFGSNWKFKFERLQGEKQRMIQFGLDAGFGELNSLGFGFMNKSR